jgi:myo-inositol 2-dehydrogenase/D-chiro-inositol 1-dehydrogenase
MAMTRTVTRRDFFGSVAAAGAGLVAANAVVRADQLTRAVLGAPQAPAGRRLRTGLIGCGGRGRGAMFNHLDSGPDIEIVALADAFPDRIEAARRQLKEKKGIDVAQSRCYTGFDAFEKLIASDVDVVLHCTPPHFRPIHFAAAVEAGKHSFLEKPLGVDPVGVRSILASAENATSKGLSVMTGTQLRREISRLETRNRVIDGMIGDIISARAFRNHGALWYRLRQPGWSDMEYMIRDWVNWNWLSGDHIVEQHIHHLDGILWCLGKPPEKAVGMGARMRRQTGDQYDFFSVDYAYDDGVHLHSTIRQIRGCSNMRDETLVGTKGSASLSDATIYDRDGKVVWKFEGEHSDALVQEHADLVTAIRTDKPINTVKDTAIATMMAIMGRESAYTGQTVSYDELMASDLRLGPKTYAMGPVDIPAEAPVPGVESEPLSN